MRKIRYGVAASLDGYLAGPNGEIDWLTPDPEVDFGAIWAQFDTALMGRRTYEVAVKRLGEDAFSGMTTFVFSRTLEQQDHPKVAIASKILPGWVNFMKTRIGKDIWLFGGPSLFRSFLDAGFVDQIDLTVIPVLLGAGIPLLPPPYTPAQLKLVNHQAYRSGRLMLTYEVRR